MRSFNFYKKNCYSGGFKWNNCNNWKVQLSCITMSWQDFQALQTPCPSSFPTSLLLHLLCVLSNKLDCLCCTPTLGRNSCLWLRVHNNHVALSICGCIPSYSFSVTVIISNTRATLGPSERHPGGEAILLIWPQNLLTGSCFLKDRSHVSLTIVPWWESCSRKVLAAARQ